MHIINITFLSLTPRYTQLLKYMTIAVHKVSTTRKSIGIAEKKQQ